MTRQNSLGMSRLSTETRNITESTNSRQNLLWSAEYLSQIKVLLIGQQLEKMLKVLQVPEVLQLPEEGRLSGGRNAVNETVLSQLLIKNCVLSIAEECLLTSWLLQNKVMSLSRQSLHKFFSDEHTIYKLKDITESTITTRKNLVMSWLWKKKEILLSWKIAKEKKIYWCAETFRNENYCSVDNHWRSILVMSWLVRDQQISLSRQSLEKTNLDELKITEIKILLSLQSIDKNFCDEPTVTERINFTELTI